MSSSSSGASGASTTGGSTGTSMGNDTFAIVPGSGVGPVHVDMRFIELKTTLGEPDGVIAVNYLAFATYKSRGLEVVLSTPSATKVEADALVLAVGVDKQEGVSGTPRPGQTRAEIEKELGVAKEKVDALEYYESGASVKFDAEAKASKIAVFAPYQINWTPPTMQPAKTSKP